MQQFTGSDDPMVIAEQLNDLYQKYGSLKEVGQDVGLSESAVSRYIALLKLPEAAKKAVSNREIPVANALKCWRKKSAKPKLSLISNNVNRVYELIGNRTVITVNQITAFTGLSVHSVRRILAELESRGLVEPHKEIRPYVYRLSASGAARLGKSFQRRWISASVMHQYLMRSAIEIKHQRKTDNKIEFISRKEVWQAGINPAHGEHVQRVIEPNGVIRYNLILIDDFQMPLDRLLYKLSREHNPGKKYYVGGRKHWFSFVTGIIIFTCEKKRVSRHKEAAERMIKKFDHYLVEKKNDSSEWKIAKKLLRENRELVLSLLSNVRVSHILPQWTVY